MPTARPRAWPWPSSLYESKGASHLVANLRAQTWSDLTVTRVTTVRAATELRAALDEVGLGGTRPTIILVGGADGLVAGLEQAVRGVFRECLSPLAQELGAAIVDGGTESGIMRVIGEVRSAAGHSYPLVGVSAAGTIGPAEDSAGDRAPSDPNHSHLVIVPGQRWGDENEWLRAVARVIAGDRGVVALLVNGGRIAHQEAVDCAAAGIPVVVLAGSGRAADALAAEIAAGGSGSADSSAASGSRPRPAARPRPARRPCPARRLCPTARPRP